MAPILIAGWHTGATPLFRALGDYAQAHGAEHLIVFLTGMNSADAALTQQSLQQLAEVLPELPGLILTTIHAGLPYTLSARQHQAIFAGHPRLQGMLSELDLTCNGYPVRCRAWTADMFIGDESWLQLHAMAQDAALWLLVGEPFSDKVAPTSLYNEHCQDVRHLAALPESTLRFVDADTAFVIESTESGIALHRLTLAQGALLRDPMPLNALG